MLLKKKIITIISIMLLFGSINAQNDTMYIMKSGIIMAKYTIKKHIDSIIFYKPEVSALTVEDVDNNSYKTVLIGKQIWMAENLRTTKYNDYTPIPLYTVNGEWGSLSTPGYCWYNNDSSTYATIYGAIYNWYTINTDKLCPSGWHVPNDNEYTEFFNYLGSAAGGRLKETDTIHWHSPNTDASNDTKFTAVPGGYRSSAGDFETLGYSGSLWSTSEASGSLAISFTLYYNANIISKGSYIKTFGHSVRCIKD